MVRDKVKRNAPRKCRMKRGSKKTEELFPEHHHHVVVRESELDVYCVHDPNVEVEG